MELELFTKSYDISMGDIEKIIECEDVFAEWQDQSAKYQLAIVMWLYSELAKVNPVQQTEHLI